MLGRGTGRREKGGCVLFAWVADEEDIPGGQSHRPPRSVVGAASSRDREIERSREMCAVRVEERGCDAESESRKSLVIVPPCTSAAAKPQCQHGFEQSWHRRQWTYRGTERPQSSDKTGTRGGEAGASSRRGIAVRRRRGRRWRETRRETSGGDIKCSGGGGRSCGSTTRGRRRAGDEVRILT
jgi:hypothetical protein